MLPCALRPVVLSVCFGLFIAESIGFIFAVVCYDLCLAPKEQFKEEVTSQNNETIRLQERD
jgi:hypothetical protein